MQLGYFNGRTTVGTADFIARADRRAFIIEVYYRHGRVHRQPGEGPAWVERKGDDPKIVTREAYVVAGRFCRHPDVGPVDIRRDPKTGQTIYEDYLPLELYFDPSRPRPKGNGEELFYGQERVLYRPAP
jgi:hypothetical protein